jgi:hypothetical protein
MSEAAVSNDEFTAFWQSSSWAITARKPAA